MFRRLVIVFVLAGLLTAPVACTPTQKGAGIGAATGAAAGALIGGHHHRTRSAAIGAAAGAVIGGVVGHQYEMNHFCPTCGRTFHRSKQFCPYDGTPLRVKQ